MDKCEIEHWHRFAAPAIANYLKHENESEFEVKTSDFKSYSGRHKD